MHDTERQASTADRAAGPAIVAHATRGSLLVLAYLAFISLGLPDGLLGVGWPSISAGFSVSTEAVGFLLTAGTVGYLTSSVVAGFSLARLGVARLLAGSTALAGIALVGYASSPGLAVMAGCALLLGLGSGAIDSGLNAYAAGAFGPRHMNWMHACFGLGVAIGPLVMTTVLGLGLAWRWGYGLVAAAQLTLALAFVLTARTWTQRAAAPSRTDATTGSGDRPKGVPIRQTLLRPTVWLGALALATYVAVEIAAGLWAFLLLTQGRGLSAGVAGVGVSIYWGGLFVGRVVQGFVAERIGATRVLRASLAAMIAGAVIVALPAPGWVAVLGFAVIGLGAAAVFPLLTLTTADRVGTEHADRTIGLQMGAAALGGALVPAGIGVLIGRLGVEVLGPALLVSSVVLVLLYAAANRYAAGRDGGAAPPDGQCGPVRPVVEGR